MSSTMTMSASPRPEWEKRIAELINESKQHTTTYVEHIGDFDVSIHPSVYSPKYFPETFWYGRTLVPLVQQRSFLEVGVGSGLVSMHLAAAGSRVTGVDINKHAVETTRANFAANGLSGTFLVSDIFDAVDGAFDVIFWNHPWQIEARIPQELKSETTFDEDYRLLRRFVAQAKNHLNPGGFVLLGTSYYADLAALEAIYAANGYSQELVQQGQRSIGKGVVEDYYICETEMAEAEKIPVQMPNNTVLFAEGNGLASA